MDMPVLRQFATLLTHFMRDRFLKKEYRI